MTPASSKNVVQVAPTPGVYTVLMIIAILALVVSIGLAGYRLMSPPGDSAQNPGGYGVEAGELFTPAEEMPALQDARNASRR